MKLGIIATQADGGDTNASVLFDELIAGLSSASHANAAAPRAERPAVRTTAALLRAARAAGPRITTHRSGRRSAV